MIRSTLPFALLLTLAACGKTNDTPGEKPAKSPRPASADVANQWKFDVKSGSIDMKSTILPPTSGDSLTQINSTLKIYFDDYGSKMATEWMVPPSDTIRMIINDGWVINYKLAQGTGTRMKAPPQVHNGMPHLLDEIAMEEIRKRTTYKDLGTKEILGHEAVGFSLDSSGTTDTIWSWKRIPLYMKAQGRVNLLYEVTHLETDINIPASRFLPPSGVRIDDLSQGAAAAAAPDTNGGPTSAPPADRKK